MKVFEIKLKVYLLQDIMFENIQSEISSFIDGALGKNAELKIPFEFKSVMEKTREKTVEKNISFRLFTVSLPSELLCPEAL